MEISNGGLSIWHMQGWREKWRGNNITQAGSERKMATEGLIVLIWHIMASDDGDEDADGDGGSP